MHENVTQDMELLKKCKITLDILYQQLEESKTFYLCSWSSVDDATDPFDNPCNHIFSATFATRKKSLTGIRLSTGSAVTMNSKSQNPNGCVI